MKSLIAIVCILLIFSGCVTKQPILLYNHDIGQLAQAVRPQHITTEYFKTHFYKPWHVQAIAQPRQKAAWANEHFNQKEKYYGENLRPLSTKEIHTIINTTHFDAYNQEGQSAITIKNEQMRELPTHKPFFTSPKKAGEGYPFDYLQNSRIHINTPLFISHYSTDGAWAFVKSPFSLGWIPTSSIVLLNAKQQKDFEHAPKIIITKDNTPLYTKNQRYVRSVKLGAIFPYQGEDTLFYYSYVFINTWQDYGKKIAVRILKDDANFFPIPFNHETALQIAQSLIGEKYGWGGYLGNRDCSAMTKDFFAPFGIWLPRNSAAQKHAGKYLSLEGLSPKEKEERIIKEGIPFQSLIYLRGHIMLYVGTINHVAMVLHNIWGLKTNINGKEGRDIIGKTVISSLYLGKNHDNINQKTLLIERVEGMVIHPFIQP
ncbi:SH3 domain-containing protein [Sulfurospirillum sp. 1612]|uniref:SH3 domain-containing protein n=1 Tax=Sulfurospirillum sp. 1612 TaxID=3094835 RepID=UPI002F935D8A